MTRPDDSTKCLWESDEDWIWTPSCGGGEWVFPEEDCGTPKGNHMRFCPFCGKPLRQRSYRE